METNYPSGLHEKEAIKILQQLMCAFKELQEYNVMHRDLKPDNIFIKRDKTIVIGDFGFAKHGSFYTRSKLGIIILSF